jgi:cytochrome c553
MANKPSFTNTSSFNQKIKLIGLFFSLFFFIHSNSFAQETPHWAEYERDANSPLLEIDKNPYTPHTIPGSNQRYVNQDILNLYNIVDWFPEKFSSAPDIVKNGIESKNVFACAVCHGYSGQGRPDTARIAGLTKSYIIEQISAFKLAHRRAFDRKSPVPEMEVLTTKLSISDIQEAADWFSKQKPTRNFVVVETDLVPETYVDRHWVTFVKGNKKVPLGQRIVEIPRNSIEELYLDPNAQYVAYVPKGSLLNGKILVLNGGDGKTIACANCHGANLTGDIGPNIAGMAPNYIVRQLYTFKNKRRNNIKAKAFMWSVVEKLSEEDIISIAAYVASLNPAGK